MAEKTILTNMCMVYDGERVLVQERVKNDWGGITFPGGHVEAGESFVDSVVREVYEETGLTITNPELCGLKQWQQEDGTRYIVICYKSDRFYGELRSSVEGRVFWTTVPEMMKMRLASGMQYMIRLFTGNEYNEHIVQRIGDKWVNVLK
ncbi:MAG: 8-oxo-dGTP diphosphatase [bacterium]|nr:8-oxo-dGTP diphosphatase [bacterium]